MPCHAGLLAHSHATCPPEGRCKASVPYLTHGGQQEAALIYRLLWACRRWSKSLTLEQCKSTIMTIHSPNSALYELFDKVLLIHRGEVVYCGSLKQAVNFFDSIGRMSPEQDPNTHPI